MDDFDVAFAIGFPAADDEATADSEFDLPGPGDAADTPAGGSQEASEDTTVDGESDRESAVEAGGDAEGGVDRAAGGSERAEDGYGDDAGEEETSMRWQLPSRQDVICDVNGEDEQAEERGVVGGGGKKAEDERESNRRFWEACLASGYP